jgi:SAM-dependent methyltransferase
MGRSETGAAGLIELEPIDPVALARSPDDHLLEPLQRLTARLARDPQSWTPADATFVREIFDERAETWDTRDTPDYRRSLEDALRRGGVPTGGRCADIGSATGIHNATLSAHFDAVASFDLSIEMLARASANGPARCAADASALPIATGVLDAVVLVNCFVFAPECRRVLTDDGALIFVSTRDDATPIYLAPMDLLEAMRAVEPAAYACGSKVGIGRWTVVKWS